ncbi:MAG: Gfo/Idh/MocA family oxidoreductase [Clostridiales bacterium]|nr:Gfo/Idh/MocA family oxidoreductase [Clostridiales bacterium]
MFKVAIAGVGGISKSHIAAWLKIPNAKITALCDVRPEQMKGPQEQTGATTYVSFDEMLEREQIDILDICLPTDLHADYAIKAIEKGINVLIEKPISLKYEDVERVYSAAEKHGVKVMVAQVLSFWRDYLYLKELVDKRIYGRVLSGSMERIGTTPGWSFENWMTDESRSGLVPFDLHIHDLDFLIYTFGEPKGSRKYRARGENQDYIHVVYEYDDFFVSADSAWFNKDVPFQSGYRFQFEDALVIFKEKRLKVIPKDGESFFVTGDTGAADSGINLPATNAFLNEIEYFVSCVAEDKPTTEKVKKEELQIVLKTLLDFN